MNRKGVSKMLETILFLILFIAMAIVVIFVVKRIIGG